MSLTHKFEVRHVGLSQTNLDIIKLWSDLLEEAFPSATPIFSYDATNHKKKSGHFNAFVRWLSEIAENRVSDSGASIDIPFKEVALNPNAYDLLKAFEKSITQIAVELGYTSAIDIDLVNKDALMQEPIALIKEISLRTLGHAFDKSASMDNTSLIYFNIFNVFFEKLNTHALSNGGYFSDTGPSELIKKLGVVVGEWQSTVVEMLECIKELNTTGNVLQANLEFLNRLKVKTKQYLFARLKQANNESGMLKTDFTSGWSDGALLANEEEKLLQHLITIEQPGIGDEKALVLAKEKMSELSTTEAQAILKRGDAVIEALKHTKPVVDTSDIEALYQALHLLEINYYIVSEIANLSNSTGCLLFVMGVLDGKKISSHIDMVAEATQKACHLKGLEDTYLCVSERLKGPASQLVGRAIHYQSKFDVLSSSSFIKETKRSVINKTTSLHLYCSQVGHSDVFMIEIPAIIPKLAMTAATSDNTTKELENHGKDNETKTQKRKRAQGPKATPPAKGELTEKEATPLPLGLDDTIYSFEVKNYTGPETDSFCQALDLNRNQLMQRISDDLEEDGTLQAYLSFEAGRVYEDSPLPHAITKSLPTKEVDELEAPQKKLHTLAPLLRTALAKEVEDTKDFPVNNKDFLAFYQKTTKAIEPGLQKQISEYEAALKRRDNFLERMTLKKEVAKAYFQLRYIEGKETFFYIPEKAVLLTWVLDKYTIPVTIWVKTPAGALVKRENFNQDEKINPLSVKHMYHTPESKTAPFQGITPSTLPLKEDNKSLIKLLAQALKDKTLTSAQKLSLIRYFCVDEKGITYKEAQQRIASLEHTKKELLNLEEKMDMHGHLRKTGIEEVGQSLQTFIKGFTQSQQWDDKTPLDSAKLGMLQGMIAVTLQTYCANALFTKMISLKKQAETQGYRLLLTAKGQTYWVQHAENIDTTTQKVMHTVGLFTQEPDLHYFLESGNYRMFREVRVAGNGQCGFNALEIDRQVFIQVLTDAISKDANQQQYRALLAKDIYAYLNEMFIKFIARNDTLMSDAVDSAFQDIYILSEFLDVHRSQFGAECKLTFQSNEEALVYLINIVTTLLPKQQEALKVFQKLYNDYKTCEKTINDHCNDVKVGLAYLKLYNNPHFWLGKNAALIFFQHENQAMEVFDKPNKLRFTTLPLLHKDNDVCYMPTNPLKSYTAIYEKGCHFNKLEEKVEANLHPHLAWNLYITGLQQEITACLMPSSIKVDKSTIGEYLTLIETLLKTPGILANIDSKTQEKIIQLHKEIELIPDLKAWHLARQAKLSQLCQDTDLKDYIEATFGSKDCLSKPSVQDLMLPVNTPLDANNTTLLSLAVQEGEKSIVEHLLLKLDADPVSTMYTDFEVRIDLKKKTTIPNTYVLQKHSDAWELFFVSHQGEYKRIDIGDVADLEEFLKENSDISTKSEEIKDILTHYHKINAKTSPLLLAAEGFGFVHEKKEIYHLLVNKSLEKALPRQDEVKKYTILYDLSNEYITRKTVKHLEGYIGLKKAEIENNSRQSVFFRKINTMFSQKDINGPRAVSFAIILEALIKGEVEHDYDSILKVLKRETRGAEKINESKLFKECLSITQGADAYISKHEKRYENESKAYRQERLLAFVPIAKEPEVSREQHNDLVRTVEEVNARSKAKDKAAKETIKKRDELNDKLIAEIEQQKLEKDELAKAAQKLNEETQKLVLSMRQEYEQKEKLKAEEDKIKEARRELLFDAMSNKIAQLQKESEQRKHSEHPSSKPSAGGFFGPGQGGRKGPRPTTTTTYEGEPTLIEKGWNIGEGCEKGGNFFSMLAKEANRLKGKKEYTEPKLRMECCMYYPNNVAMVRRLNQELKQEQKTNFDENRANYNSIQYTKEMQKVAGDVCYIRGVGRVEGVILCNTLDLPAIYIITVDIDGNLRYAAAKKDGYHPKVTEVEVIRNTERCPVIFIKGLFHYGLTYTPVVLEEDFESPSVSEEEETTYAERFAFGANSSGGEYSNEEEDYQAFGMQ